LHARLQALQSQVNRDKATALRRQFAVESRDPYGFQPLVEFTLGIPNDQFWRAGKGRWLARRVLADRVPEPILRETRRGLQCPEWYAVMSGRREGMIEALERIERSPLASRVVDTVRMRDILENWPKDADAAKYAGAQIYAHALNRALSIGGFLRWYEGGNG
jgi:asparagine synthase (glutamine-hydrolysing)